MSKSKGLTLPVHEALMVVHGHTTEIPMPYAPEYRGWLAIYADSRGDGVRAALDNAGVQAALSSAGYGRGRKSLPFGQVVGVCRLEAIDDGPAPARGFLWRVSAPRPIEPIPYGQPTAARNLWPVAPDLANLLNRAFIGAQKQSASSPGRAAGASKDALCEKVTWPSSKGKSA